MDGVNIFCLKHQPNHSILGTSLKRAICEFTRAHHAHLDSLTEDMTDSQVFVVVNVNLSIHLHVLYVLSYENNY